MHGKCTHHHFVANLEVRLGVAKNPQPLTLSIVHFI